ncbi:MAG: ROK family protein [Atopobiaceae bacterium]|jgi:glucokinase|nr:ROK family protein [Atopobiaceae bacterium]MCH4180774.1 ROK family protein [Atopobiaceae bacterium]MCH4214461.1 ROK family protein [Atopobiaceae bacterium]MCH4229391.1 ROK family protein [Atopobiaceae bacterium]MCH4276651.1 ROK family protein [Atopobiaceae bacterium]
MPDKTKVVALDIGGTKIACGIVDLGGDVPLVGSVEKVPTDALRGGAAVLSRVIDLAKAVLSTAGGDVAGIGVSSAGVIDPRSGDVTFANDLMPGWGGTHLAAELSGACGVPVRVMGDVHAHAFGEARWGAGRDLGSCLVVAVGTGIGGAFVERGTIMLGAHDVAGHVGHVSCLEAKGIPCSCGRSGHLEPIASGPGIVAAYVAASGTSCRPDGMPIGGAEVSRLADAGDPSAVSAEERAGRALGGVLGSLCNTLDPAGIILSGSVAQSGRVWHEALAEGFASQAMDPVAATPILEGALGGDAPLVGAAENLRVPAYAELRG